MEFIQRVITVIQEEIDKIESILDEFGDDNFIKLASEQAGLERILAFSREISKDLSEIVLKTEYYGALPYKKVVSLDKDGLYIATIPDLPGCITHGKTEQEALMKIEKAKAAWIEIAVDKGLSIPEPSEKD